MILTETLKEQYQRYFSKSLLDHAIDKLLKAQFAETQSLPQHAGAKSMRFHRPQVADTSTIVALSEGAPINTFDLYKYDTVDFDLVQYGQAARLSDIVSATSLWDHSKYQVMKFSESAALWCDSLIRDSICQSKLNGGLQTRFSGAPAGGSDAAKFTTLQAGAASTYLLAPTDLLDGVTQLRTNKAPTIKGGYVLVGSPQSVHDIQSNQVIWTAAKQYSDVKDLYNGETGSLFGIRVVWDTNPMIEGAAGQGVYNSAGNVFTSIITGMGAYAAPRLSGNNPSSPKMMVVDTPDSANPLGQFITIGWKAMFTAGVLNQAFALQLKSQSTWVAGL